MKTFKMNIICNAGILPYMIAPNPANDIYVLLGKEENIVGWKYGSNKWSSFAGCADEHDVDVENTAAREFVEESMAMISIIPSDDVEIALPRESNAENMWIPESLQINVSPKCYVKTEDIYEDLKKGNYTHKITMKKIIMDKTYSSVSFLKRIPWQPELPIHFEMTRTRFILIKITSENYRNVVSNLKGNMPLPGNNMESDIIINIHMTDDENEVRYSIWNVNGIYYKTISLNTIQEEYNEDKNNVKMVIDMWQRMRQAFYRLPYYMRSHPALVITMIPNTALLLNIQVKDCYMEKQSIEWWSLPRLTEVLRHGGVFRGEMFRSNFLPFLAVVIEILKTHVENVTNNNADYEVNVVPWRSKYGKMFF